MALRRSKVRLPSGRSSWTRTALETPELSLTAGRDHGAYRPAFTYGLHVGNNEGGGWKRFLHSALGDHPFTGGSGLSRAAAWQYRERFRSVTALKHLRPGRGLDNLPCCNLIDSEQKSVNRHPGTAGVYETSRCPGAGDGIRTHDFLLGKQTLYH